MLHKNKHFLEILAVELEDLREDVEALIAECQRHNQQGTLTEHVFLGNLSLFKNEVLGVGIFESALKKINPDSFADLDSLIAALKDHFRRLIEAQSLAPVLYQLVERKIEKVAGYVAR